MGNFIQNAASDRIIVALLLVICAALARFITYKMIKPIENVAQHMDDLDSVEVYDELKPFVATTVNSMKIL